MFEGLDFEAMAPSPRKVGGPNGLEFVVGCAAQIVLDGRRRGVRCNWPDCEIG